MEVSDTSGNYVQQNVLMSFIGYYVSFTPLTLPVRGVRQLIPINNSTPPLFNPTNIASIAATAKTPSTTPSQNPSNIESLKPNNLNDIVGDYPGIETK